MSYTIATDIHTHTLFSRHAYSTIGENVAAARAAGLELLGSADHMSSMLFPEPDIRNFQFFYNQVVWPRVWDGVTLLRGAEADIVSLEGGLFGQDVHVPESIVGKRFRRDWTLYDRVVESLDYLVASVHNGDFAADATLAQTTEMYVCVLQNPKVFVLGHTGRSGIPYDLDEVLGCAKEQGKLIEINNHSLEGAGRHHQACRDIAVRCAELGVGICVSSDAHIAPAIGDYPCAKRLLEEIHFPQELIMNRDRDTLLEALAVSGVCDLRALKGGAAA
ncbi:phosphatase [Collinsella sp. An2]|uniref:phosphatase n=1 Tax=Collinsella sp. An2 TaxID=1965585 RepID=UPI000B391B21|nr:phosphatase [Collinsella sp. An2]OUP10426.1 phosphatase [Collinsella sp. An2]